MKTKVKKQAKAGSWKDAKVVELSVSELACVAGGRRHILHDSCCVKCMSK
jgi:hypothetical protein